MSDKKADTSIDQLITLVNKSGSDQKIFASLINSLIKTIPIQKGRKTMPAIDENLNQTFKIKRINYSILGKVLSINEQQLYNVEVLSIVEGETRIHTGDILYISKGELALAGKKVR